MKTFIGLTYLVLVARTLNTSVDYLLFGTDGNGEKIPENDARMRKLLAQCTDEEQEVIIQSAELFVNHFVEKRKKAEKCEAV